MRLQLRSLRTSKLPPASAFRRAAVSAPNGSCISYSGFHDMASRASIDLRAQLSWRAASAPLLARLPMKASQLMPAAASASSHLPLFTGLEVAKE